MRRFYDDEIAALLGLNEAIILNDFAYWVRKNQERGAAFHDGRYWTYSTIDELCKRFQFWGRNTIRRAIGRLVVDGYIEKGCFTTDGANRTTWYTITEKAEELLKATAKSSENTPYDQNGQMHSTILGKCISPEWADGTAQNGQMHLPKMGKSSNKKKKEGKEENKKETRARARLTPPFVDPSPRHLEAWQGFVEMRKSVKKPLTERAAELITKKLERLAPGDDDGKAAILDQSVERGWLGVFPIKQEAQQKPQYHSSAQPSAQDLYAEAQAILNQGG